MTKLKTLKDLMGRIGNAEYFYRKDIERKDDYDEVVIVEELKAEAVKWYKYYKEKEQIFDVNEDKRNFIKKFFNLSEEDLK